MIWKNLWRQPLCSGLSTMRATGEIPKIHKWISSRGICKGLKFVGMKVGRRSTFAASSCFGWKATNSALFPATFTGRGILLQTAHYFLNFWQPANLKKSICKLSRIDGHWTGPTLNTFIQYCLMWASGAKLKPTLESCSFPSPATHGDQESFNEWLDSRVRVLRRCSWSTEIWSKFTKIHTCMVILLHTLAQTHLLLAEF